MSKQTYCVGNIGIDIRITSSGVSSHPAGTALRCTLGAALYGLDMTPVSAVGPEFEYERTFSILRRRGVSLELLCNVPHSIRFTTRYGPDDTVSQFSIEYPEVEDVVATIAERLDLTDAAMVVVCPMRFAEADRLLARARASGASTVMIIHYALFNVHPATSYMDLLSGTDYLIVNLDEGQAMTGLTTIAEVGACLGQACRKGVFLTLHDKGATFFARSGESHYLPSIAPRVANVLGAGDTFAGGVIAGLHFTNDPCMALTYGLLASSLVLAEPDHKALLAAMDGTSAGDRGA
jgi:sugar/nucleoside kinase (ribokinase family)